MSVLGAAPAGEAARWVEATYRAHGHVVLRRARAILGSEDEAREALQEIFASFVDRPGQFRGQSAVTTWLYSVTTHHCLNKLRDRRNRTRLFDERAAKGAAPAAAFEGVEDAAVVRQLLERLPEDVSRAAVHYYLDEMTHDEIARVLGCSRRHVGDLLVRLSALVTAGEEASCP